MFPPVSNLIGRLLPYVAHLSIEPFAGWQTEPFTISTAAPLDNQDEKDYILIVKRRLRMGPKPGEMVQGTLEMLILKTLALESMHGYGVAQRIEQVSQGVFRVNPGSLLPALARMERAGQVKNEWRSTENNRRAKYYALTQKGKKALKNETDAWDRQTAAISRILEA
jgi:PadR family transcriptional regulator, regulatory protein PadR